MKRNGGSRIGVVVILGEWFFLEGDDSGARDGGVVGINSVDILMNDTMQLSDRVCCG